MNVFDSRILTPFAAISKAAACFSQSKLRRHELWAVTCYFRPEALRTLVLELLKYVRLTDVYVAYNSAEDFRYPDLAEKMKKLTDELVTYGIDLEFRRIRPDGGLFHPKGYAIIQRDGKTDKIRDNYLLITSGNLTNQGLGTQVQNQISNFELSYGSDTKKDVLAFMTIVDKVWDNMATTSMDGRRVSASEVRTRLLLEAVYLCKWEGTLRQELSATFRVADASLEKISKPNPLVKDLGFDVEQKTLAKYYFGDRPPKPLPKYFIKNYTVNSLIGHWCPTSVWNVVKRDEGFQSFKEWLKASTSEEALQPIDNQCQSDLKKLKNGNIEIVGNPMEGLRSRIKNLIGNEVKMRRLYCQYESFPLRLDLEDPDGVDQLFESLVETAKSKGKKNFVIKNLVTAIESCDPDTMNLTKAQEFRLISDLANGEIISP